MTSTGHVFIATSLDGYIAGEGGDISWLDGFEDGEDDHGYGEMMARVDGLIMGSNTFRKVLSFGGWHYEKPVVVLSRSMKDFDIPERLEGKVWLSSKKPQALMEDLFEKGWRRAYVDGGEVIRSFLAEGLIEDMTITRVPVLLGKGIPLFSSMEARVSLKHKSTKAYPSGLVSSNYLVLKDGQK